MYSACNQLFACSRFACDEDRRITSGDFGDAREYGFQSRRGPNNLFKHRGLIDFFAQSDVFAPKPVFSLLSILDVRRGNIPTHNLSLFVTQWVKASQKPAITSVALAHAHLQLESSATSESTIKMTVDSFPFIRMSDPTAIKSLPPLFKSKAEVIEQDAVGVKWFTIRPVYRNNLRRQVQNLPKACFLFAGFVFRQLAISNVLDRTKHLPGKARRISLQIALTVHDTNFAVGANDPMFCVYAHFALNGFASFPKHKFSILGMDQFPNCRQFNGTFLRVQSVDPVGLI